MKQVQSLQFRLQRSSESDPSDNSYNYCMQVTYPDGTLTESGLLELHLGPSEVELLAQNLWKIFSGTQDNHSENLLVED